MLDGSAWGLSHVLPPHTEGPIKREKRPLIDTSQIKIKKTILRARKVSCLWSKKFPEWSSSPDVRSGRSRSLGPEFGVRKTGNSHESELDAKEPISKICSDFAGGSRGAERIPASPEYYSPLERCSRNDSGVFLDDSGVFLDDSGVFLDAASVAFACR